MSVMSTGQQPLNNLAHDVDLAIKICKGVRPGFSNNTPKFYIELAFRCMDANPDKHPTTDEVYNIIKIWNKSFNDNHVMNNPEVYGNSKEQHELESIKKVIDKMDKVKFDPLTTTAAIYPNAVYTSRLLKFTSLP